MNERQIAGHIAWTRTVKGDIRFMVMDFNKIFPDCVSWTDQVGEATVFQDTVQPNAYFEQLRYGPTRRFMGKIFPPIAVAVALDLDSEVGEFEGWFGVSPFYFEPSMRDAQRFTVQTKIDPDPQHNTSNESAIRTIAEFVEYIVEHAKKVGEGNYLVITRADLIRDFNPRTQSGDARRIIEALRSHPQVKVREASLSVAGVRIEIEYQGT